MLGALAIILIVVGVVVLVALLLYMMWPTVSAVCFGDSSEPLASREPTPVAKGTELPPLVTPA